MTQGSYLSIGQARKIVRRCSVSKSKTLDQLIRRAEMKIRIIASMRGDQTTWRCPLIIDLLPSDLAKYRDKVAAHLRHQGFHVKVFNRYDMYISWKYVQTVPAPHKHTPVKRNRIG